MPNIFDQVQVDDANFAFSDETSGFAESLTYRKAVTAANPSGTTRTVYGVVERMSPTPGPTASGALAPRLRITLPNNTTRGITSAEWKPGDAILVAQRYGGTAEYMLIHFPSDAQQHDPGMVTWEIR